MPDDTVRCNGIIYANCNDNCSHAKHHTVSSEVDEDDCCEEGHCSTIMQEVFCEPTTCGKDNE